MSLQREIFDFQFSTKVDNWVPLRGARTSWFTDDEIELLERSRRQFREAPRTVVLMSFENTFAALGGLAAVMRHFPAALAQQNERVVFITPFHAGTAKVGQAVDDGKLMRCLPDALVNVCNFKAHVSCFEEVGAKVPTYHIGIENRFIAGENPYGYTNFEDLVFDAFAFSAVVPSILSRLGYEGLLLFHAHEWETAPIALFSQYAVLSGVLYGAKTVVTLHNSFDAPLTQGVREMFFKAPVQGDTVLQAMLPLVDGPLSTVSTPFAHELRHDPLQRIVFADHLQTTFKHNPPVGIENGIFGKPDIPFSKDVVHAAEAGDYSLLLRKKRERRITLLKLINAATDERIHGKLDSASMENDTVPVLFMSGRLDVMQKGFDVVFQAMRRLPRGTVRLFFSPTLNHANEDISFFTTIAGECAGDIVIWPFLIDNKTYEYCQLGSSFLVMPSMYEPFGSVSEGHLHGTPLIARATGGLLSQIIPESEAAIPAMHRMFFPPHVDTYPNSILYRERCSDDLAAGAWRSLLNAPLEKRIENPLYCGMVDAALAALLRAATIYSQPAEYGRMLLQGLLSVRGATWKPAVKKYQAIYDTAQFR